MIGQTPSWDLRIHRPNLLSLVIRLFLVTYDTTVAYHARKHRRYQGRYVLERRTHAGPWYHLCYLGGAHVGLVSKGPLLAVEKSLKKRKEWDRNEINKTVNLSENKQEPKRLKKYYTLSSETCFPASPIGGKEVLDAVAIFHYMSSSHRLMRTPFIWSYLLRCICANRNILSSSWKPNVFPLFFHAYFHSRSL